MTARRAGIPELGLGFLGVVAAGLPYVCGGAAWLHSGRYASVLAVLALIGGRSIFLRMRRQAGAETPYAPTIALSGGVFLMVLALCNALLDADTVAITGGPGDDRAVPGTTAHVRFLPPSETGAAVTVRRADGSEFQLSGHDRRIVGVMLLRLDPQTAAQVAVHDAQGRPLTVTRPQGGGFLAPLLIFGAPAHVAGSDLPTDTLAVPAAGIHVLGFSVDRKAAGDDHFVRLTGGKAGVLFDIHRDDGKIVPGAVGFVADGTGAVIAGLHFGVTLTAYPRVLVSSVPVPSLVLLGVFTYIAAAVTALLRYRRPPVSRPVPRARPDGH